MFLKHIVPLFIPLSMTVYIENFTVFRFSRYFCFLEQKFRRIKCKIAILCNLIIMRVQKSNFYASRCEFGNEFLNLKFSWPLN